MPGLFLRLGVGALGDGIFNMGVESLVFRIGLVEGLGEGREGGGRGAGLGDGLGEGGERVVFLGGVSPSLLWYSAQFFTL